MIAQPSATEQIAAELDELAERLEHLPNPFHNIAEFAAWELAVAMCVAEVAAARLALLARPEAEAA